MARSATRAILGGLDAKETLGDLTIAGGFLLGVGKGRHCRVPARMLISLTADRRGA